MKFLCICQYGHSRSVALARRFHHRGIEAVACGAGTAKSAIEPLANWAETICILDHGFGLVVPKQFLFKITEYFIVGPDRWSNPYHPELNDLLDMKVEAFLKERK
jgi:hypothetical protein